MKPGEVRMRLRIDFISVQRASRELHGALDTV
jgi:hypothetical protein